MKKNKKKILKIICLTLLLLTTASVSVSAHRIYLDVVQQTITVEAYFGDGKAAKNAEITVYTSDGGIYLTGTTDEDGRFSFDITEDVDSENMTVEVEQVGHKDSVTIGSGSAACAADDAFLPFQVIAGLGYLLGLAGIASLYSSWKTKNAGKKK